MNGLLENLKVSKELNNEKEMLNLEREKHKLTYQENLLRDVKLSNEEYKSIFEQNQRIIESTQNQLEKIVKMNKKREEIVKNLKY